MRALPISAALVLGACIAEPPPPEALAAAWDPDAPALTEDGYRAGLRADGTIVFDIRHTARDLTKFWINDVAECVVAAYALERGYGSASKLGQGEITVETGEGFPQPVMQASYTYRLGLEGDGAAETLEACRAEGLA